MTFSDLVSKFKESWSGIAHYSQPLGTQIYQKPSEQTTMQKVSSYFLRSQEFVANPQAFTDTTPPVTGLHGTTKEALGAQLSNGKFEDIGLPVFFVEKDPKIPASYARQKAESTGGTPIVVEIATDANPQMNDYMNKNLGAFQSVSGQNIYITRAWEVRQTPGTPLDPYGCPNTPHANISQLQRFNISIDTALGTFKKS